MKKINAEILHHIIFLSAVWFFSLFSLNSNTEEPKNTSLYTKNKFFVKTKRELKVSEATGEISIKTGILSIDNLNKKYGIKKIKSLFRLDNGSEELYEELGLEVIPCQPLIILEHDYPTKRVRLHFVRCILPSGAELASKDVAGWFDMDEAARLNLCPADQIAFKRLPWDEIFDLQNTTKRKGKRE